MSEEPPKREDLSKLQRAFVDAYVENPAEPIECLRLAGGRGKDALLLRKVKEYLKDEKIIAAIRAKQAKVTAMEKWTTDQIEDRLCQIAGADLGDIMKWNKAGVEILDSMELEKAVRMNVAEVSCSPGQWGTKWKIKLNNPVAALEALARIHAMFNDKLKITLEDELENLNDYELEDRLKHIFTEHPDLIQQLVALAAGNGDPGGDKEKKAGQ